MTFVLIGGLLAAVVLAVVLLRWLADAQREAMPYRVVASVLTEGEAVFCAALRQAQPDGTHLLMKVRLLDLFEIHATGEARGKWRAKVAQKHVDFVLVDAETYSPRLVIELDDRTHQRTDRRARDEFVDEAMSAAGLPILHIRAAREYDAETLRQAIDGELNPET